jgi:hypothetical protein
MSFVSWKLLKDESVEETYSYSINERGQVRNNMTGSISDGDTHFPLKNISIRVEYRLDGKMKSRPFDTLGEAQTFRDGLY